MLNSNKPTRYYSTKQEKKVAKNINGKRQINSGATPFYKGDVQNQNWLIECKTTTSYKKSFAIKKEWLDTLTSERLALKKDYCALAFNYEPNGKNYYVIDERLFLQLIQLIKEQEDG